MQNKRGVGSIVAWVLLVGLGVSLGLMVTIWAKQQATKTTEFIIKDVEESLQSRDVLIVEDIVDLGLIYGVDVNPQPVGDDVKLTMTFTSPFCPYGPQMVADLERQIKEKGAEEVRIDVTFEPPWQPSEELKQMMGMG